MKQLLKMSIDKKEQEIKVITVINNEKKEISDETLQTMNVINETYKKFSLITYNIEELNKFKDNILSLLKERDKIYIDKLVEYKEKADKIKTDFDSTNKISNSKFSKIIDNQAKMTSRLDQFKNYETFVSATNDKIISHEVRLNNMREDFSNATQKYDRIYLDNLELPGYIGRCAKYKNCQYFFLDVIKDLAKLNQYREKNIIDLKMYKEKLETIINSMNTLLDNNNESQLKYINDTKEKILKDCNNMFESVIQNMKEIRVDNSKYAVDLISQSMDLSKKWDKIEKIREDLLEKFNYSVNKYQMLTDDTIKSFDEFKTEYGVIRRKFMELAEFIKDVRFRKNIGENVKKKEIKIMVKKMLRRKKSFEGKDVHLLNDIANIENIDYKKYYNDDIRSNSLKLIQNKKNEKMTPGENSTKRHINKNKKNSNTVSKELINRRDLNKSVEDIHSYKTKNKNSLTTSTNKKKNTNAAEISNRSINISSISPVNLDNIKNNVISMNKSAIINGVTNYKSDNTNTNTNNSTSTNTIDIKFRNEISTLDKNKDTNIIKGNHEKYSKEKTYIQEKEKKDEMVNTVNKYNKSSEINYKNNENNYNTKSNEINSNNNENNNYNYKQNEINNEKNEKNEKNYISAPNEKNYDIKEYTQQLNHNNKVKEEELKSNRNKTLENNNNNTTSEQQQQQQFSNNKDIINRKDVSSNSSRNDKNDMITNNNEKCIKEYDDNIYEITNSTYIMNRNIKKKDEVSQISLSRAISCRSNLDAKPSLIDDTSSISSDISNANFISARNYNNNIGLSSEKSLSIISENNNMMNNNINKFLMNDIHLENNDKIIKELASELEQSTAKKDMLASNKKEIEQKFKNACNKIEPINLLNTNNNNNYENNINSNSYQNNNNDNNNINTDNHAVTKVSENQIINTHINNSNETERENNNNENNHNNDNDVEKNYNTSINISDLHHSELHHNINEGDVVNNSNINMLNTINKSTDDLQYRTIQDTNRKYVNDNHNYSNHKNNFNRSVNDSINNLNPIKLNNEIYVNDNFNSNTFNKKLHAVDQKLLNLELYTKEKILDLISQINLIKHSCNLPTSESFTKEKTNVDMNKISCLANNKNSSNPKFKTFNSSLNNTQNPFNNNNSNSNSNTNTCNQQTPFHLDKNKENISNNKENNRNINNINNSRSQYVLNNIEKKRYSLREVNPKYSLSNQKISRKNKLDYNFLNNKNMDNIIQSNNLTENNNASGDCTGRMGIDGNNKKIIQGINNDINSRIFKEFEKKNHGNNKEDFANRSLNNGTNNFAYSSNKFKGTEIKLVDLNKLVDHQLPRNRLIPIRINNNEYFVSSYNK